MRLCFWTGALRLLPLVVLLTFLSSSTAVEDKPGIRHYYIAAVPINWDYSEGHGHGRPGPSYKKVVFREYEEGFSKPKAHPPWLGLLGPTLRGVVGDTIVVTFKNMADRAFSMHPHGVAYGKQSEGALYFDNTSRQEKKDDMVQPGEEYTYYWELNSKVAPQEADPPCLTYTYQSHMDVVRDYNSGLLGTLLVCKPGSLNEDGQVAHHEYVLMFGVFDESQSWYKMSGRAADNPVKYTINGYTRGAVPGLSICAHAPVSLHLVGMSSEPEVFSVHMNGQMLVHLGHRVASVGLIPGSATSVTMTAIYPGRWLISSQTNKHLEAGMHGFVDVVRCEAFPTPRRRLTIKQSKEVKEWTFFIAAEEVVWDYAPNMPEDIDGDLKFKYLTQGPQRIGRKYKKVVYTQYADATFTKREKKKTEVGVIGPVIRAQIRDVITIVFKNKASRPYSIYPHGLTIDKEAEGANYPAGGNQTHGVEPGQTHTYVWRVIEDDEPFDSDSRCLTRMYHSAVNAPKDIASGLIGPLLICKSQSLTTRNVQLKADKEQHAMFTIFDENKSWYLDHNIQTYTDSARLRKDDSEFYQSNVMHTINGYVYENGEPLGFCNAEIVTWHVSSVGAHNHIQTVTFYGHVFQLNDHTEDFLSLFPMSGATISMNMDNIGVWLMASLNSHETTKGMRVKFRDVECFKEYEYEMDYTVWTPQDMETLKEEPEPEVIGLSNVEEFDPITDEFAELLNLRSAKSSTGESDMEYLDLSFLDNDFVDSVSPSPPNNLDNSEVENMRNSTISQPGSSHNDSWNHFLLADRKMIDTHNLTSQVPSYEGISESRLEMQDGRAGQSNMSVGETGNRTIQNISSLQEDNMNTTEASQNRSTNAHAQTDRDQTPTNTTLDTETMRCKVTRGDAFYPGPPEDASNEKDPFVSNASLIAVPLDENSTASLGNTTGQLDSFKNATNQSEPVLHPSVGELNLSRLVERNTSSFDQEMNGTNLANGNHSLDNMTMDESGNSSVLAEKFSSVDNSSLKHKTSNGTSAQMVPVQNVTANASIWNHHNLSEVDTSSPSLDRKSSSSESASNETMSPTRDDLSLPANQTQDSNSVEDVDIYLKDSNRHVIRTTSLDPEDQNWGYDTTHHTVAMEMPDHMIKYIGSGSTMPANPSPTITPEPTTTTTKPKVKVLMKHWAQKGQSIKTKRRKTYKPQAKDRTKSGDTNRNIFSPRGFNPRGSRPISKKVEDLMNKPIVIGIPRADFSEYELYSYDKEEEVPLVAEVEIMAKSADYNEELQYVGYKDPYSLKDFPKLTLDETSKYYLRTAGKNVRKYFVTAEEVEWDYSGYGQRVDKSADSDQPTRFTKVMFRGYVDETFQVPDIRGEMEEHLGILGPVIKAEVGQTIMVIFRNLANRPFSLHPNGVHYTKHTEGLNYKDESDYWFQYDNAVQPNTTFTYIWNVHSDTGPMEHDTSDCRTWVYYSGVNPEKDIHSGLIGPLLVCRPGTIDKTDIHEFTLLFMTFDESQSWYYDRNRETLERKNRRALIGLNIRENFKFHAINGIIFALKGLRMYSDQLVRWHLINMGPPQDVHSVHFHGQTVLQQHIHRHRQGVYPLLPGGLATLDMIPSRPGLWQLETEVGLYQQKGMQTLMLILDKNCFHPLGLESRSVTDAQLKASSHRGSWEPSLARLHKQGTYNAWSTDDVDGWIQVDFQRPVVISQVATQGAKEMMWSQYVTRYAISYSTDRRKWTYFKGESSTTAKVGHKLRTFTGNNDAHTVKTNTFFPPLIGRYVRLHPLEYHNSRTVRLDFYGCELDGCSIPLGMENGKIEDVRITASSTASSWYSGKWLPSLARLNAQGTINAWQAKYNSADQWLQVELAEVRKITGIVTQGAKALGSEKYVRSYALQYSDNGVFWTAYTDDDDYPSKTFPGNTDNNGHVKNYIYPPIFSRFIRIIPLSWHNSITMRIELLGCDFE